MHRKGIVMSYKGKEPHKDSKISPRESRSKMDYMVKTLFKRLFRETLEFTEMGTFEHKGQFDLFKKAFLRFGNDKIRDFEEKFVDYKVEYVETSEDLMIFRVKNGGKG